GTTANGDNADTFAEQLCEPSGAKPTEASDHYLYKGKCIAFTHRDITLHTPLSPTSMPPPVPKTFVLRTMRSVHGPVHDFATSGGRPVALVRATAVSKQGVRGITAFELFAEGAVHTPQQFVTTMRHYTGNENWFYVDSNHIGWLQSGWFPRHAPGTDLELPIKGTGAWDWKGFNASTNAFARHADSFNPTAIDPAQGYLSSWNNKGAREWRAAPGIWSYGPIHRDLLLRDPTVAAIKAHRKLTLSDLVGISGNASTQDLRGVAVLPDLLKALGPVTDARQKQLVADLQTWVRKGAHRRSTTGAAYDDDSAAVLVFDAWWRALVHGIYDPQLGKGVVTELQGGIDLVLDGRAVQTGFYDGWYGQVFDLVRSALGTGPHFAATHCGTGTLASCRSLLRAAFTKATATVTASQGQSVAAWKKPVHCPADDTPTCDETRPIVAGAVATPAQPWENRGTFHQAVEVLGPLDRRIVQPPVAPGAGLPATGGAPAVGGAAVLLLLSGAACAGRSRWARRRAA
ncbi:MAG: hypothetical protein JWO12_2236, partial [Frankiales bacterium]|nr:hypothetical protein [Frankiales bacterium]